MDRTFTRTLSAAALALLAAACSSNPQPQAQTPTPASPTAERGPGGPGDGRGFGGRGGFMRNPVQILVDSANALGLSADQRQQLAAIAQELEAQNRVPMDSLARYREQMGGMRMGGGMGDMTPEQQAAMEHARPFMQQVRQNNQAAMQRALAVLTQARIRAMMPQRGMGRGGPGGPPPQP
jgi:hypothetical protein